MEWRRDKFSKVRRAFLYISDRLAQISAHRVIVDNEALRPFLVKSSQKTAELISYPGDHVLRLDITKDSVETDFSCLTVCRIEPENNCHLLLEAFAAAGRGHYIFVGNWNASEYGRKLRILFKDTPGLEMRDPTYDGQILASLRENCTYYLHGHSVGGTNPSLVEMLFYDCQILAYDCSFNRATAGDAIKYFENKEDLTFLFGQDAKHVSIKRIELRSYYTRNKICGQYSRMIAELTESEKKDSNDVIYEKSNGLVD